jgi:hypothetical protein
MPLIACVAGSVPCNANIATLLNNALITVSFPAAAVSTPASPEACIRPSPVALGGTPVPLILALPDSDDVADPWVFCRRWCVSWRWPGRRRDLHLGGAGVRVWLEAAPGRTAGGASPQPAPW